MTVETLPCARCGKPPGVCICDRVVPVATKLKVVILQHPQEDDVVLGTAKLVELTLPKAEIRVGLSWASIEHALGVKTVERERWAVLAATKLPKPIPETERNSPVLIMDRKGRLRDLKRHGLEGIIVLDGTWSQAKTLWWRNAWLLKLPVVVLKPREASMYGKLRKAPRKDLVSTLEAVAEVLPALGESAAVGTSLRRLLRTLLQRARDHDSKT
jgi:hypothetical protein